MHRTPERLFIAVRADLAPGLAAAQIAHAAFLFATQQPERTVSWFRESQYLIVVDVPDETALIALASRALHKGLMVSTWSEPDLAGQKTAVALEPGPVAQRLCANYPLHGRPMRLAV